MKAAPSTPAHFAPGCRSVGRPAMSGNAVLSEAGPALTANRGWSQRVPEREQPERPFCYDHARQGTKEWAPVLRQRPYPPVDRRQTDEREIVRGHPCEDPFSRRLSLNRTDPCDAVGEAVLLAAQLRERILLVIVERVEARVEHKLDTGAQRVRAEDPVLPP